MPRRSLPELIARIYEAAVDEKAWPLFVDELAEMLAAPVATLYLANFQNPQGTVGYATPLEPVLIQEFNDHYSKYTPWSQRGRHLLTEGAVVTGEMVCSAAEVRRSEYSEYLRKLSVFHAMGAVIRQDGPQASMLAMLRPTRRGPFDTEDVQIVQQLMPHLQRAHQVHERIAHCRVVESGSLDALNRTAMGVIVLNLAGRVLFQNQAAEAIVRSADGLLVRDGALRAAASADTTRLREFLANAKAVSEGRSVSANHLLLVRRPSLKRPYVLTAMPFPTLSILVPGVREAATVVYVRDPETRLSINGEVLRGLYGLTDAEIEVSTLLASGHAVDAIAAALGITAGTTRWHLKRVFEKTGTRSQADLVRAVLTCATVSA
jgi:DNA-binding CsgD family transcriptional regulator